jgi:hypothetical protein
MSFRRIEWRGLPASSSDRTSRCVQVSVVNLRRVDDRGPFAKPHTGDGLMVGDELVIRGRHNAPSNAGVQFG